MKKFNYFLTIAFFLGSSLVVNKPVSASSTDGTIDQTYRYAWGENIGWIDFGTANGNVHVTAAGLSGYALSETVGWINLGSVANDGSGRLSGYAWSENTGWINFSPTNGGVTINASGEFNGAALSENAGWIIFGGAYKVKTDWRPQGGTKYSLTYAPGANGTMTGTASQVVNAGSSGTAVTALPNAGYHFVNWSDGSTANPRTDSNVQANVAVTANFAINAGLTIGYADVARFSGLTNGRISAAAATKLLLRRASVGGNVSDGLNTIFNGDSRFSRTNFAFQDRGNPGWAAKITDFNTQVAAQAANYDVFSMKFCYIDYAAPSDNYINMMNTLEAAYPTKLFVWWTMPTTSASNLAAIRAYNQAIRTYAAANNKILFDLASIESHQPDGTACTSSGTENMCAAYTSDGGHLNATGQARAAQAFWVLMSDISDSVVSGVSSATQGTSAATITWTTDRVATSTVEYGLTASYGSALSSLDMVTSHSVSLSGLTPNTTYHYRVKSKDVFGNETVSGDNTFLIEARTLSYASTAYGSISGSSSQIVRYGANGTAVTAVPITGYRFVRWSDDSIDNPRTDLNVTSNLSVTAIFEVNRGKSGGSPTVVYSPKVEVRTPANGSSYKAGTVMGIEFVSADGAFTKYRISYSSDDGASWTTIADKITSSSWSWTVPDALTTKGKIKVEGFDAGGSLLAAGISNGNFAILERGQANPPAGSGNTAPVVPDSPPPVVDPTVTQSYTPAQALANTPDVNTDKGLNVQSGSGANAGAFNCTANTLIKSMSLPDVYYCGADGKRYVFVNDKVFFSWYEDFASISSITDSQMAAIPLGGSVTYRPGKRMVKIQSDPRVYAVARGGVLRWIPTENEARNLFGDGWNKLIDDIPDSFFVNYRVGEPL